MKIAYLDCFSGISGDMFLGALLDSGLPFDEFSGHLGTLPLKGFRLDTFREDRKHIFGTRFVVIPEDEEQPPRGLREIREIIEQGQFTDTVKEKSVQIFEDLARVEGEVHNLPAEEVHFHEIGAVDSIVDIVGAVYGVERLGIQALFVSSLPLGSGFVVSSHGRIPIPAPATAALLKDVPVFDSGLPHEMVTPTGAALVKGLATSFGPMPSMVIHDIGYGVGKRDLPDRPNLARILIGHQQDETDVDTVVVLETNLDDTSPEVLGYLMERLFDAGGLDVVFFPVQMKKGRPGVQVQVIGRPDQKDVLMEILFKESTTLGIRFRYSQRKVLTRSVVEVDSPWGKIKAKKAVNSDGSSFFLPEYEVCRKIALENNRPLKEIFSWVMSLNQ
ncbi:MAG: nickel pincer cofactor biosynthesis protein LarC [Desulfobacteraceae bacterium]|nr:nickel pincer cofactor biosynthesis protein LarC [Desulfobacteraceae bacterium]